MNKLLRKYDVAICDRNDIKEFLEKWHYSKSINGVLGTYYFKLTRKSEIIGAAIFGNPAMSKQLKSFGAEVIELRRLACIDNTEKNTESYFIGRMLRWLKQNTNIKTVVSYADPEYGYEGVVYKASNFLLKGKSAEGKVIYWEGKKYHDKAIRTKHNGELKPFARKLVEALKNGTAFYKKTKGKNIYVYFLR